MRAKMLCLLVILAGLSDRVLAQGVSDRTIGTRAERTLQPSGPETITEPTAESPHKDFEISVSLPLFGTNNAVPTLGAGNSVPSGKPDLEFNPDILLHWSHQFENVRLTASAGISSDRFFYHTSENEDYIYGSFKAYLTDGKSDRFVPYIGYSPELDLLPTFAHWDDTLNDFYAGFRSGFGWDADGKSIAFRDAVEPGNWSVEFDVSAGYRLAAPSSLSNTFVILKSDINYTVSKTVYIEIEPKFRARWYADYFGDARRDYRVGAAGRVVWTPDWLTSRVRSANIQFAVGFLHNFSNLSDQRYNQWEGGPILELAWSF